jgi:hypothetical protein
MTSYLALLATLIAVVRRSKMAAGAAVVVGFGTALGFIAVHVLPDWGTFSDGYLGAGVDELSWLSVGIEIVISTWLGVAGLVAMSATHRSDWPNQTLS